MSAPLSVSTSVSVPPARVTTWERALEAWRRKLQSETTRATYCGQVRFFFRVDGVPELGELSIDVLDAYAGALRLRTGSEVSADERLAPATFNLKLTALRSFLGFCRRRGWLSPALTSEGIADALGTMHSHVQRPYQIVEDAAEWDAMLAAAAADAYDPERATTLVALALGAGLRIAELCALDVGDLAHDSHGPYVDVREGKGRKQRQVPISVDVEELVIAYIDSTGRVAYRTADLSTPLLLSRKHGGGAGRLTTRQARRIIMALAHRASVDAPSLERKHITPHGLRHSYALRVLTGDPEHGQAPAPLPAVSKLLGHSSVATTGRYLAHFERKDLGAYAPILRRSTP